MDDLVRPGEIRPPCGFMGDVERMVVVLDFANVRGLGVDRHAREHFVDLGGAQRVALDPGAPRDAGVTCGRPHGDQPPARMPDALVSNRLGPPVEVRLDLGGDGVVEVEGHSLASRADYFSWSVGHIRLLDKRIRASRSGAACAVAPDGQITRGIGGPSELIIIRRDFVEHEAAALDGDAAA